jgi:hypothetical protein
MQVTVTVLDPTTGSSADLLLDVDDATTVGS